MKKCMRCLPAILLFAFSAAAQGNSPPSIGGQPRSTVYEGEIYKFTPTASDADGDRLSFSIRNKPRWAAFSPSNGKIYGPPGYSHAGLYSNIVITVSDGKTSVSMPPFTIQVIDKSSTAVNTPPVASPLSVAMTSGTLYKGRLPASDPNGDALHWSITQQAVNGSAIVLNSATGDFSYTPRAGFSGDDRFGFQVKDPAGALASAQVSVQVKAAQSAPVPGYGDLQSGLILSGSVTATLHPGPTVQLGSPTKIAFGIPFPPEVVAGVSRIVIRDGQGRELPSHVAETARWRSLSSSRPRDSLRSALVYLDMTFTSRAPVSLQIHYDATRTRALPVTQPSVQSTWVSISNNGYPAEYATAAGIMEPQVYVTLPASWLSATLLRTRSTPLGSSPDYAWLDEAYLNFSRTAVNDVSQYVASSNLIAYQTTAEPWLFDRAMTLFGLYVRSGDVKWLRHAHRAAQFYARKLNSSGGFTLLSKPSDLKYSYGQSLFLDLMLMGDSSLLDEIQAVGEASMSWRPSYLGTDLTRFWTERHQTYALLGALSAWEATGQARYADRVKAIANASFTLARNPVNGWAKNGCLQHSFYSHESYTPSGYGNPPTCSPWMSALFADAVLRYYVHSADSAALEFLAGLGDYVRLHGSYVASSGSSLAGLRMPYYLASSVYKAPADPWSDFHHACDAAGLTAKAAWARSQLGGDSSALRATTQALLETCSFNLSYMHREGADVKYGQTVWRLSPPREYNWWFGTTGDLEWMIRNTR